MQTMSRPAASSPRDESPRSARDEHRHRKHWESWTLRALLAALVVGQLVLGNRNGATVAGMGLAVSLIPPLISRFSGWHVPRMLELTFVFGMFLQYVSESLKLFEIFTYWDKLVHPAEIFLATGVATFLLLGYRKIHNLDIPDGLAAAGAMMFGMVLGASWELVEFAFDWFGNASLQKSNADTMTDILTNDAGAIFGALFAFWLYRHHTDDNQRVEFGKIADWLTDRLSHLFGRHGFAVGAVVGLIFAAIIFAGWLMDRAPLPPATGAPGVDHTWILTSGAPRDGTAIGLAGGWSEDARGVCRTDPQRPAPGSEKMGLYALEPGNAFSADHGYAVAARYYLERPPFGAGTAMEAGVAFGLRDPDDFYVVRADATHDVVTIERYLHGHRREWSERRVRTRGDEWHELGVRLQGMTATALLDGQPVLEDFHVPYADGGVALWARATSAACFSEASVKDGA